MLCFHSFLANVKIIVNKWKVKEKLTFYFCLCMGFGLENLVGLTYTTQQDINCDFSFLSSEIYCSPFDQCYLHLANGFWAKWALPPPHKNRLVDEVMVSSPMRCASYLEFYFLFLKKGYLHLWQEFIFLLYFRI